MKNDINHREYDKFDDQNNVRVSVVDKLPTAGNNPSIALSYDVNGNLQYIDETINDVTYRTTLTYSSGVLVGISKAVEL